MKKIKIGIPRALMYYRYGVLWKHFFESLGCKVILSPKSNQEILTLGINNTIDECCLPYKLYIGHVLYLSKIADYIIVSRICDYGKKDKVCTRFNGLYDDIKCLISKNQILEYNIEHTKLKYEFFGLLKIGLKVSKNPIKIILSYIYAKNKQKNYELTRENEQKNKLNKSNKKILLISNYYNLEDNFISKYIVEYFNNNNITLIYSNYLDKSLSSSFSDYFSDTLYWKYAKEKIGSLYYYRHQIDGIIYISSYPCSQDALVNNLSILKNNYIPSINIIIDENITEVALETKLESFLDIIKGENNE